MNLKIPLLTGILLLLLGCSNADEERQEGTGNYFDLKGFFAKEVTRLSAEDPAVTKTVRINGDTETKRLKITDWHQELSAFADADINKASWKGAFSLHHQQGKQIYLSDNEKVNVKKLTIMQKQGKIYGVEILLKTTNMLYTSTDTLRYYPDSLYRISRSQNIRLFNPKQYSITAKF